MPRATILYDDDCGFCRWSLARILAWDRPGRLRPLALQDPDAAELLAHVPEEQRASSWHLVSSRGEVRSAGAAVGPLLRLLPGGRPLAALAEISPGMTERAYRLVAANRDRLGRLVRAERCRIDPAPP